MKIKQILENTVLDQDHYVKNIVKLLKLYSDMKESPNYKMLTDNNIFPNEDTIVIFLDPS